MLQTTIRLYADTSVYGGVFDEEFAAPSRRLVAQLRDGGMQLVTSALVRDEIADAPAEVRDLYRDLTATAEVGDVSPEALELSGAYVAAGIVSERWALDTLHVAVATIARCSVLVSWNFRHIVHFQKGPLYNAVSRIHGYGEIHICSPHEVIFDVEN